MEKFKHDTHTVYTFRELVVGKRSAIVVIRETGNRTPIKEQLDPINYRFIVCPDRPRWKVWIRLPFFKFTHDNCGFEIGSQNLYLWYIYA